MIYLAWISGKIHSRYADDIFKSLNERTERNRPTILRYSHTYQFDRFDCRCKSIIVGPMQSIACEWTQQTVTRKCTSNELFSWAACCISPLAERSMYMQNIQHISSDIFSKATNLCFPIANNCMFIWVCCALQLTPNDNGFAANAKWISHFCVNICEAMSRRCRGGGRVYHVVSIECEQLNSESWFLVNWRNDK